MTSSRAFLGEAAISRSVDVGSAPRWRQSTVLPYKVAKGDAKYSSRAVKIVKSSTGDRLHVLLSEHATANGGVDRRAYDFLSAEYFDIEEAEHGALSLGRRHLPRLEIEV